MEPPAAGCRAVVALGFIPDAYAGINLDGFFCLTDPSLFDLWNFNLSVTTSFFSFIEFRCPYEQGNEEEKLIISCWLNIDKQAKLLNLTTAFNFHENDLALDLRFTAVASVRLVVCVGIGHDI